MVALVVGVDAGSAEASVGASVMLPVVGGPVVVVVVVADFAVSGGAATATRTLELARVVGNETAATIPAAMTTSAARSTRLGEIVRKVQKVSVTQ
jgi:hypothetical protein